MKLRDLEYLVAVDEERHFHTALRNAASSASLLSAAS